MTESKSKADSNASSNVNLSMSSQAFAFRAAPYETRNQMLSNLCMADDIFHRTTPLIGKLPHQV